MNAERLLEVYEQISEAPDAILRLRRFVLDLAVRGKLVEQDAGDESAPHLLEKIEERKAAILEETGMRKPRKVADMNPAEIWADLPANWAWTQISNLGFTSPRNVADDDAEASFVPMPMIAAEYGIGHDHEVRLWGKIKKGYTHFADGDVGLAKITPCFENGKSTVFRNLTGGFGSGTTELHVLRPVLVDPDYVVLFLKSPQFIETGIPKMTGTAGQKRVSSEYFTSSPFPLPPLSEQHRIVAKVDELMALCDRLEEARKTREETRDKLTAASLARLTAPDTTPEDFPAHAAFALEALPALTTRPDQIKALRQTILNLAVRGKLVEQDLADGSGDELLKNILTVPWEKKRKAIELEPDEAAMASAFPLPPNWTWATVQALTRVNQTVTYGILKPEWMDDGVPTVRVTEMKTGEIDASSLPKCRPERAAKFAKTTLEAGDLLISKDGTIGKTAFVPPQLAGGNITQHVLRFPICAQVERRFIRLAIDAPFCQSWMDGETKGVALQGVNVGDFRRMPIPLPPLAEQRRIVAKVDALMALCDRLEAALSTAYTTRTRLLEALLHEALEPAVQQDEAA